jgi:hypothetical protein
MINRCDDAVYELARDLWHTGPEVFVKGGEYTLFIDSTSNSGTLALQQQSPSGQWIICQAYGLQYLRTTAYSACILGIELSPGLYRLKADGLVLNLNAYLVGSG